MTLAISVYKNPKLLSAIVLGIVGFVLLFKTGGKPALRFAFWMGCITFAYEMLFNLCGPIPACVFGGIALTCFLIYYGDRWWKAPKTRKEMRLQIIKLICFIAAIIGVCALVFYIYRCARII